MTVIEIIERETGQSVDLSTRIDSLGLDSLEFVDLLLAIGNECGKEISFEAAANCDTVFDLMAEVA